MSRLRFSCTIENGKMFITDRESFDSAIERLDGSYYIELKESGVRSAQQNNYYWKIVNLLADDIGYTDKEMHQAIKDHFEIKSTKHLSSSEFSKFIEKLIRWAAIDFNVVIPDPNLLQSEHKRY